MSNSQKMFIIADLSRYHTTSQFLLHILFVSRAQSLESLIYMNTQMDRDGKG